MKNYLTTLGFCLVLTATAFGQREETIFGSNGLRFSGVWGGWTNSIAQIDNEFAAFSGGMVGLEFGKSILIGYGAEGLINDIEYDAFPSRPFEMRYSGLLIGYGYRKDKVIHPQFTILTGGGRVETRDEDNREVDDKIFTIQPAIGVEINVLRWFHVGLTGGYRIVADTDLPDLNDSDLSAPFGQISFKFGFSWGSNNRRNGDTY